MIDWLGLVPKLTAIYDAIVAALASILAAIAGRAPAASALSNATWTDAKAGYLDAAVSSAARIKSIQHLNGSANAGSGNGYFQCDYAITAVNPAKAFVIFNGANLYDSTYRHPRCWLQDATTVRLYGYRTGSANVSIPISATVIEFY